MSLRLNWSKDGTKFYRGNPYDGYKSALSATHREILDAEPWSASYVDRSVMGPDEQDDYLIWNFPQPVRIDKLGCWMQAAVGGSFQVSDDTDNSAVPGVTGTWTTVKTIVSTVPGSSFGFHVMDTPTYSRWFRWNKGSQWWVHVWALHLFGEYESPLVQLYDIEATPALITDPTYFDFPAATTNIEYAEEIPFKVHNNDVEDHTYLVTLSPQNYEGVTFIDDHFTLSVDGGTTKVSGLTTELIIPGGNSQTIVMHADIPSVENPGTGWYYPKITVTTVT